ncbi:MAG: copper homeostasis protein CutC [Gordonia sp. (in: high G+C Gram-positive bacteria)]|uniref:copper homeostasis protein CutC n=1 Tax=Gordonia sp. (in: high G+C Gram-positive bacteria) TaxID=84139 RepID=UPI003BB64828
MRDKHTGTRPLLEIAVQDATGAAVARAGGADRVELCTALGATGGLTPSPGTLAQVRSIGIEVHALIRNRPGGFVYDDAELGAMADDIRSVGGLGTAGVVIGVLNADGEIDVAACRLLIAAAREAPTPLHITFHRALDVVADQVAALATLADLGVDRVLTSGGARQVGAGMAQLARLTQARSGVQIMAGGGLTLDDLPALIEIGVDAVHLSAKRMAADPGRQGPGGGLGGGLEVTDPALVSAAAAVLNNIDRRPR